jgi:coenzyme F420-0:L-glutamate ligase/coenzyme F420-1:gamma-L-glutamate ligase
MSSMRNTVTILGLEGLPLVKPGDDITQLILKTADTLGIEISSGDIIVISHKILSKSEGRIVELARIKPSARAIRIARRTSKDARLVQLILNESRRIVKVSPGILLVEAKQGIVCLNAGIDKSNVEGREAYCLLPKNSSSSAKRIAKQIADQTGKSVGVVVADTYSRPFRTGQSEFAIGLSGLNPFVDYRGSKDLFGNVLRFKRVSIADELASAAELVMGQGDEGVPVAIIKGANRIPKSNKGASSRLTMRKDRDLFKGAV